MAEQSPSAGTEGSVSPDERDSVNPPLSRYARAAAEGLRASLEESKPAEEESASAETLPRRTEDSTAEPAAPIEADAPPPPPIVDVEPVRGPTAATPEEVRGHERPEKWRHLRVGGQARRDPADSAAIVPVPPKPVGAAPTQERVPFWKRITMPRAGNHETTQPPANLEPILTRLAKLESQVSAHHSATLTRLNGFEENITRLWELEDQLALTEVRERLALLEANQQEIADGLHAVARNLSVLAVVLGISVAAGLLGLSLLL